MLEAPRQPPLPPIIATGPYQPEIPVTPIFVTPLPPTNTQVDNSAQKERGKGEECLADAQLEFDMCAQRADATHLTQYNLCEAVSWTGWVLNFISRGRLGEVPDTCGVKLDLKNKLDHAQCETNHEVNKQLCRID
ncbi:MAG: hypothetical protein NVV73_02435 [Cellvibrionaceae bacterium]|nr:hypothetical protein [Cellvibrionaceae bacterium]